jgi:hypothetical protein
MPFTLTKYTGDPVFITSLLKLILDTGQDLTSATSPKINYKTPSGTESSFVATVESPASDGKLSYEIDNDDVTEPGEWRFWPSAILSGDANPTIGSAVIIEFYDPGEA